MDAETHEQEVLPRAECMRLLSQPAIGRVALSYRTLPVVVPVSFRVLADTIHVRTQGSAALAALCDTVVAFEVDDIDPEDHTGWNVVVTGRATGGDGAA